LYVSDGSQSANIALLGQYTVASFTAASDGYGGTLITDPPAVLAENQLTAPQPSVVGSALGALAQNHPQPYA
jgi:hypothetical protein